MSFFKEIEQKNHQTCMEPKKIPNSQSNSVKKRMKPEVSPTWLQIILQSYNNPSMVFAEKETHRPAKQNWKPRNKTTCIRTNNFWQRNQKHNGKKKASSINGAGKTGKPHAKEWNWITVCSHVQKLTRNGMKTCCCFHIAAAVKKEPRVTVFLDSRCCLL